MKYLILGSEPRGEFQQLAPEEQNRRIRRHQKALNDLLRERVIAGRRGLIFVSVGLGPFHGGGEETVTVKNQAGVHLHVDGPFPETKELVGGFDVIDFESPDEAIADDIVAQSRHLRVGNTVSLLNHNFTISGIVAHGKGARFKDKITLQVQDWELVESDDDEPIHAGALVPIYSTTEGLPQRTLRSLMWRLVEGFAGDGFATVQFHPEAAPGPLDALPFFDLIASTCRSAPIFALS